MEAGKLSSLGRLQSPRNYPPGRFSGLAEQKGIELLMHLDQVPEWVRGALERIRQILTNLIANAIKFTLQGEVVLTVSVIRKTSVHTEIEFAVGIPESESRRMSLNSLRLLLPMAAPPRIRRHGSGLAICKQLATHERQYHRGKHPRQRLHFQGNPPAEASSNPRGDTALRLCPNSSG